MVLDFHDLQSGDLPGDLALQAIKDLLTNNSLNIPDTPVQQKIVEDRISLMQSCRAHRTGHQCKKYFGNSLK